MSAQFVIHASCSLELDPSRRLRTQLAPLTTAGAVKSSVKVGPVGRVGDKDRGAVLVEKVIDNTLLAAALQHRENSVSYHC